MPQTLPKSTSKTKSAPVRPGANAPKWVLAALIAIAVGLFLLAGGGVAYALHMEEDDSFCASCHTEPEAKYFDQSKAAPAVSLAAFHAQTGKDPVRCIDCHSGGGTLGRAEGIMQGQEDLLAYWSGHYRSPAVTTNKLSDDSCLKCHADIPQRASFQNHFHRFLSQWQAIDPNAKGCVDCHAAHTTNADFESFMQQRTVRAVCDDCHAKVGR